MNMDNEKNRQLELMQHNLKDIIRNLGSEYNFKNNIYNQQQKLLNKYDFYIDLQNKKLNRQIDQLNDVTNFVSTRDRLIETNEASFDYKKKQLYSITTFFILIGYLIFVVVAYLSKKITFMTLLYNIIGVVFAYMIYLTWYYNWFGTKSFINYSMNEIETARGDLYNEMRRIEIETSNYINQNCDMDCVNNKLNNKGEKIPTYPNNQ